MKTKEQIEAELKRIKLIEKEYENCTPGTDGYRYWQDAFHTMQTLQWVLGQ